MKTAKLLPVLLALLGSAAFAQSAPNEVQRDVNQQQRIESGLKSGQLNTREAAKLEHEEARIKHTQNKAMRDGQLSDAEKQRIQHKQNKNNNKNKTKKHKTQTNKPKTAAS